MKLLKTLCFAILGLLPTCTWAQFNQVNIYPPEAASLMRKVDFPVSHKNGMPEINIPLYSIKAGSLTLPLDLSFHMDNFIRANQMPGSVGAGWSLSSEVQISRTINGVDDLLPGGYCSTLFIPSDYTNSYQTRSKLQKKQMIDGIADEEPDKFFYQLLGKSGAFYFQKQTDGSFKPVPVPYNGVKINYINGAFSIIDTDGTTYSFSSAKGDWVNDGIKAHTIDWKCVNIKNASGVQEITFDYASSYQYVAMGFNDRIEVYDNVNNEMWEYACYYCPFSNPEGWNSTTSIPFWQIAGPKLIEYLGKSTNESVYAYNIRGEFQNIGYYGGVGGPPHRTYNTLTNYLTSTITFRGGSIVFSYINSRQLSSIQVKNEKGNVIKTISFSQSYSGSPGGSTYVDNKYNHSRILNMLQIDDQKYSFTYGFDRQFGSVSDLWGYRADAPDSNGGVPIQQIDISMGNWNYLYDGTPYDPSIPLTTTIGYGGSINQVFALDASQKTAMTITFPTGGRTEFIVGQNRFRDPIDAAIKGAGGYRIEKIRYFDAISPNPVKEKIYKYGPNEDGTGILKSQPSFDPYSGNCYIDETETYIFETWDQGFRNACTTRKRTYLSGSSRSLNFSNGAAVNYNEVAEYDSDMGQYTGKTVYKYDIYCYSPDYTSPTDPYPLERNDWDIGMPDSVIHYKYQNGQFKWVKRKNMDYNKFTSPYKIYCARTSLRGNITSVNGYNNHDQNWYTENYGNMVYKYDGIETGTMQLVREDEAERDDNGNVITSSVNYFYNNPDPSVVSRVENTGSDGITTTENITYPGDYAGGDFITSLITKNIVSVPVEKITRRNGKIISGQISTYNTDGTIASTYQIESNQINESGFKLSNRAVTGDYSPSSGNVSFNRDPNYKLKFTLNWDSYFNLLQVSPTANIPTSYIWGYSGTMPIVKGENIDNTTLGSAVSSALASAAMGDISEITKPSEDAFQKLKLKNFNTALRNNSLLSRARITTYTYLPLVGMTSQTDPNGITTYYEYDTLGRLKNVKDHEGNILKQTLYHYQNQP